MNRPSVNQLRLILGPANSGKQGLILDWWQQRLPEKPVVVAPTAPDARRLSLEMAERTGGLVGQSQAVTFDGLVRLILGRSPRYATDLERALIAARLLHSLDLEALGSHAHLPGVGTGLVGLLDQLRESGLEPHRLDHILSSWALVEPEDAALAGDIRRLMRAQEQIYAAMGITDRPAALREASSVAGTWQRPLALYGFTSFTAAQREVVIALSQRVEVLVTFTYDHSREANLTTPAEIAWWTARAATTETVAPPRRAYTSASIEYLERHFMSSVVPPPAPPAGTDRGIQGGVRFLLASGQRAEAELAAEKIADLLRGGFRPGEIAVIVRNAHSWGRLLSDVFESCGIPYHLDDRCSVRETGLGHAFLSALRGVVHDDARALLAYLRSPYSGLSLEEVSDLDLAYRRGTNKGAQALAGLAAERGSSSPLGLWTMVGRGAVPGSKWDEDHLRFAPMGAEGLVRDMLLAGLCGSEVGDRSLAEDVRAFRALQTSFVTMKALASVGEVVDAAVEVPVGNLGKSRGAPAWLDPRLVLRSLGRVAVPGGRVEDEDAVQVLSVQRARARRFQAVVMLGLVEGEFPGPSGRPSLLSRAQRSRLDEVGGGFLPPESDQEVALFLSAVSRSWQLLFLSARNADDDGTESVESHYWQEARRLLGVSESDLEYRTLSDQVYSPDRAPSLRHYLRACVRARRTPHVTAVGAESRVPVPCWSRPPSRLVDPAVLSELASIECFSPSILEVYADCPFAWFAGKVVGAEDIDVGLDGRAIGGLLHSVLSETYSSLASAGLLPLKATDVPRAEQIVDSSIDRRVWEEECPGTPAERRLVAWRLKRMARNLFDMEVSAAGPLVFAQGERRVGEPHGVDIGGVKVRGRIDRVDTTPDGRGMFVLDYKTGFIPSSKSLGTGEGLQLPLYLLALAAERPDMDIIGGAYISLSDKKRSGVVKAASEWALGSGTKGVASFDETGFEKLSQTTLETAIGAARGIRAGAIAPRDDRVCPSWCTFGPACRARRAEYRP